MESHVRFRWEVAQIAEVLDKGTAGLVGKDVVDARRVGAFGGRSQSKRPPYV